MAYSITSILTTHSFILPCKLTTQPPNSQRSLYAHPTSDHMWYMQNGLQLNPDKSKALLVGTSQHLKQARPTVPSVTIAGVDLPVAEQMKVLGVVLDQRLTFVKHATAVVKSCNYHAQAIRHILHLLTLDLAQTLACSLILSRVDYCNALLHCAPAASTISKLQRVQNNAARIILQSVTKTIQRQAGGSRCFAGWRSSRESYTRQHSQQCSHSRSEPPAYLSCHLQTSHSART